MQPRTAHSRQDPAPAAPALVPAELLEALARILAAALIPPPQPPPDAGEPADFLTTAQLARRLGVSRETIRRLAIGGTLPHTVVCRGTRKTTRRYPRRFADDFAATGVQGADLAAFTATWRAQTSTPR
jgi:excisionase family DNA binding protein